MDKKNSFSEELLSGYLDGELSEEDAQKVCEFAASSLELREDLSSLVSVGEIFSSNFKIASDNLNLWQAIEGKLVAKQPAEIRSDAQLLVQNKTKLSFWNTLFSPSYGAAFALGLFAIGMLSSQWVELPEKNDKLAYSKIIQTNLPLQSEEILVPLIPKNNRAGGAAQTFVSNSFPQERGNDFSYSPQFISPQQLGAEHPARGSGVRADGMQIEWMKNPKDVRFLRHKNERLPPMIWVGDLK